MKIRSLVSILLCGAVMLGAVACTDSEKDDHTSAQSTLDAQEPIDPEIAELAKYQAYLDTIAYPSYQLLDGSETPGFVGRWFEKRISGSAHQVTLSDGSTLHFMVNGATEFDIHFTVITTGKTPYFAYSIDGGDPVRQLITESTVTLPDNGMHTVCIYADGMTEGEGKWEQEKGFAFKEITLSEGRVCGIMPTNKVIAYFGDSITEGIRALNINADSEGNSATNAYPYFCSKALGAVTYNAGYGASGVTKTGSFNTFINAIDHLSKTVEADERFCPDIIVVNHGTNDSSVDDTLFKTELRKALDRLLERYPNVPVFYAIPFNQSKAQAIRDVAAEYGDAITVVETDRWRPSYTDSIHPNTAGAKKAGESLAAAIYQKLGADFFAG